jgi:hypothetical protein
MRWILGGLVVAGLLALLERYRRHREFWTGPHYMAQIQSLKNDRRRINS